MTQEQTGACACGAVQYQITGPVKLVVNCHCNACRKRNGTPYTTYCVLAQEDLNITQGQASIATYEVNTGGKKRFCSQCGTPLYNRNKRYPGVSMLYHGTLSQGDVLSPAFNIHCDSKLAWVDNLSGIKSFEQGIER